MAEENENQEVQSLYETLMKQEEAKRKKAMEMDVLYGPEDGIDRGNHFERPPENQMNPNSPFAKRGDNTPSTVKPPREKTSPSFEQPEMREFINQRPASESSEYDSFVGQPPVTEHSFENRKIEDLVLLGRVERQFEIAGNKISLQTLTAVHNIDIVQDISQFSEGTRLAASIIGTMVRAIRTINGKKLYAEDESEYDIAKFRNINEAKLWLLSMQQTTINAIYREYAKLIQEQNNQIGEIKNL